MPKRTQPTAEEIQSCIDELNAEMDEIKSLNKQRNRALEIQQAQESEDELDYETPQQGAEPASQSSRAAGSGGHPPGTRDPRPAVGGHRNVDDVTERTAAALSWVQIEEWERGNLQDRLVSVRQEASTEAIEANAVVNMWSRQGKVLDRMVCAFEELNLKLTELIALLAANGVAVRDFASEQSK